ncbi:biotin synthase [Virgibacillus pantothenticus]|uniref:Biotin synthase n=1 Tax=Virgibacillus pantothenticus TaxID=1473 RepID=A0A0L0QRF4_VIRPA|nr:MULTISPECIES: biotin synthase BioB [Virgibacillus]API92274.1 biotin synthase BioB [Virgibacillus sp. 6R]KNE21116.1 biotin synthase [Virgibacillus pantothenticus]MBS7427126.1 biotin synthase BioB [Virgibacillus sp. 19R1-5]MBU8567519.1 biotin synthase BioB [Virgibacillus pantothenticus]MBU8601119.1 biotin synthase BioB [Virgibacillus pantothenticus]
MLNFQSLANAVVEGYALTEGESLAILNCPDDAILPLLHSAFSIRKHYYGNKVKLNMIINTKSGACSENCGYCAQSRDSTNPIQKYKMMDKASIIKGAERAMQMNAGTYCIVASGRGPTKRELNHITSAVKEIKEKYPLKICACLGILKPGQAEQLKDAGVDRYNHNINTSKAHHHNITTSHTYQDRVQTLNQVKKANISPCSGVIIGMKETKQDVIQMALALKELEAASIPVNFLHAMEGTLLEGTDELNPLYCLKVLCLFRFTNPTTEIRVSGGREVNLRSLQPLSLYPANSIFIGDYLTTAGQVATKDFQMLKDLGFEIDYGETKAPVY